MRVASLFGLLLLAASSAVAQTPPASLPSTQSAQAPVPVEPIAATEPATIDASRITLHMHDVSPRALFAELARQANTEFSVNPPNLWLNVITTVSVDIDREPFWQALRDVCQATGTEMRAGRAVDRITLRPGALPSYPSIISGPFLVSATGVRYRSEVQLQQPGAQRRESWLRLQLDCEPKFPIMHGEIELLAAEDANGNSVLPDQNSRELTSDEVNWSVSANVPIRYTPGQADRFNLRGIAHVAIQTRSARGEIDDVLHSADKEFLAGPYRLRIEEVEPMAAATRLTFVLTRAGASAASSMPLEIPLDRMVMLDGQGAQLELQRVATGNPSDSPDESRTSLLFRHHTFEGDDTGAPAKLIWELPTEIQTVDVPFELKNLPLP